MGCSGSEKPSDQPLLLASIPPVASIVEEVAGEEFQVTSVVGSSDDPETFEPSVSQRMKFADAAIFFNIGQLPFEKSFSDNLLADNPEIVIVDTSDGIKMIHGTHSHGGEGHSHGSADPHVWSSVKNISVIARNIADALALQYPEKADVFSANLNSYLERVDSLDNYLRTTLSDTPSSSFIVWHPSLSYFARDYDLEQIAVGIENKELSPAQLRDALKAAEDSGAKVIFIQKEFDPRAAESILQNMQLRTVTINPMSKDIFAELTLIANELQTP